MGCFEKAQDDRGTKFAKAKMYEERGRICAAERNDEGFRNNMNESIGLLLGLNLIDDACRNLLRIGEVHQAAGKLTPGRISALLNICC